MKWNAKLTISERLRNQVLDGHQQSLRGPCGFASHLDRSRKLFHHRPGLFKALRANRALTTRD